jgi:thiol:disulfide interchange protein DsbD
MRFPALPRSLFALLGLALLGGHLQTTASAADSAELAALGGGDRCAPFLCVEDAFKITAAATAPDRIEVTFKVAKGYYLYRGKLKFTAAEGQSVALGTANLPDGDKKNDEFFGEQEVYHHDFVAKVPVARGSKDAFTLPIKVGFQGCAEDGICFPPTTNEYNVEMPEVSPLLPPNRFPRKPMCRSRTGSRARSVTAISS